MRFFSIVFSFTRANLLTIIPVLELKQKEGIKAKERGQESSYMTDIGISLSGPGR